MKKNMNSAAVKKSVTRPKIVNLKKENLNKIGFDSLKDWYYVPDNVYAGCNLHKYLHVTLLLVGADRKQGF